MNESRPAWLADYLEAGYEVFPLRGKIPRRSCAECRPSSPHYRPHGPAGAAGCAGTPGHDLCHGLLAATSDLHRVAAWWTRWPHDNIGARVPQSLLVLDVDPRHGGDKQLAELEATHGPLPPTRTSWSGRGDGGHHRWFLHPGGKPSAARLGDGLDLKGYGGYVVLPPSRHPDTGGLYHWEEPVLDPAAMPSWLRQLLLPPLPTARPKPLRQRLGGTADDFERLVEAFASQTTWGDLLEVHGWTCADPDGDADGARWRHPGATHPVSATIRHGCLFVYSQATAFQATEAGDPHGYTKLRAFAVLEHNGDQRAAVRELREAS
jgi:hypothetical protein